MSDIGRLHSAAPGVSWHLPVFKNRPVEVNAVRVTQRRHIETLEGRMLAEVGDWLIKGVNGELYLCKDDVFRKTYECCNDEAIREWGVDSQERDDD